jgi:ubiquinone/menaquinone biosynthesis C-methylase UbiE
MRRSPGEFSEVDAADDPESLVKYLDRLDQMRADVRRSLLELLPLEKGNAVLDVGCGTGPMLGAIAEAVTRCGRVVGIDGSEAMIAEARRRHSGDPTIELRVGDAHALELEDASFDVALSVRVLLHLEDPRRALREMIRVVRPGGRVLVSDPDWETLLIDAADEAMSRRVVELVRGGIRNGTIGRRLYGMFLEAGLVDVRVTPRPVVTNVLSEARDLFYLPWADDDAATAPLDRLDGLDPIAFRAWCTDLERRDREHRFFSTITAFPVCGRKP